MLKKIIKSVGNKYFKKGELVKTYATVYCKHFFFKDLVDVLKFQTRIEMVNILFMI